MEKFEVVIFRLIWCWKRTITHVCIFENRTVGPTDGLSVQQWCSYARAVSVKQKKVEKKKKIYNLRNVCLRGAYVYSGQCVRETEEEVNEEKFIKKNDTLISGQLNRIRIHEKSAIKRVSPFIFFFLRKSNR